MGLRDALAHSSCRRDATSDGLHEVVHVVGTAPLLVREYVAADLELAPLHELDICLHALSRIRAREEVADVRVRVQTAEL